jgi:HAD superfamily hydrolase (TIGR01509 family)
VILFDNDGVLVDSEPLANRVLAELLTSYGIPTTVEDSIRDYMGGSMQRVRDLNTKELPADFEHAYHERVFAAFRAELQPVPGIPETLARLDALGIPYCVASSGTHERIRLALTTTGLRSHFPDERIFSSQDVAHGKPAPDLFLHAAAKTHAQPEDCIVVEDSPLGVQAAKAAGMRVIGYTKMTPAHRLSEADVLISDMSELFEMLIKNLPDRSTEE